jgi:hypothetical protein
MHMSDSCRAIRPFRFGKTESGFDVDNVLPDFMACFWMTSLLCLASTFTTLVQAWKTDIVGESRTPMAPRSFNHRCWA